MYLDQEFCENFEPICNKIFQYLDLESLLNCKSVSWSWYNLITSNDKIYKQVMLNEAADNTLEEWKQINKTLNLDEIEKLCVFKYQVDLRMKDIDKSPFFYLARMNDTKLFEKAWPILQTGQFFNAEFTDLLWVPLFLIRVSDDSEIFGKVIEFLAQKLGEEGGIMQVAFQLSSAFILDRGSIVDYIFQSYPGAIEFLHIAAFDEFEIYDRQQSIQELHALSELHSLALDGNVAKFIKVFHSVPTKSQNLRHNDLNCTSPLHLAIWKGHYIICEYIIENLDSMDTKLMEECYVLSVRYGHREIFDFLYEKVDNKNPAIQGSSALHCAAKYNRSYMFSKIFKTLDSVYEKDCFGYNPVFYAAKRGDFEMVRMIIEKLFKNEETEYMTLKQSHSIALENRHFKLADYIYESLEKVKSLPLKVKIHNPFDELWDE